MVKNLFVVLAAASAVFAQSSATGSASAAAPSTTAGLDACILTCTSQALVGTGCTSVVDLSCICVSAAFQSAALACLQANCTSNEVQTAINLQSAECASVSGASSVASVVSSAAAASSAPAGSSAGSSSGSLTSPVSSNTAPSSTGSGSSTPAGSSVSVSSSAPANTSSAAGKAVSVFTGFGTIALALVGMAAGAAAVL